MSIAKFINLYNNNPVVTVEMHNYLSDDLKTDNGKYINGLGFITDNYLDEFNAVKIANQKTIGNQFRQITVSISPAGNSCSDAEYMEIGQKIAQYFFDKGYQIMFYLHKDTDTRHLHFMLNSVNFKSGKMFTQSKHELNLFKVHCNHVLSDYNLDQIRKQTEDMIDNVIHNISNGFDCLEIFDEIMADKASALSDLFDESSSNKQSYSYQESYEPDYYYFSANIDLRNNYSPAISNTQRYQEVKSMNNSEDNKNLPTINTEQLPTTSDSTPGLNLDYSKNVNISVPKHWEPKQVADLINNLESPPESERAYNAKIGDAVTSDLYSRGNAISVNVDSSFNINIGFDDILSSDIIDIPYEEKD